MFSARLFIAVVGMLSISDTAQAKADDRRTKNITIYIKAADKANDKALSRIHCVDDEQRENVHSALSDAKEDFRKLLSGAVRDLKETLGNALILETGAQNLVKGHLKSGKDCQKFPKKIESAIKNIKKAMKHTVTDEASNTGTI